MSSPYLTSADWIDKAVLLPLVKAVFAFSLKEQEIKAFLSSSTLRAMVSGRSIQFYGIQNRYYLSNNNPIIINAHIHIVGQLPWCLP